jgi:hypothetical protein
MWTIKVQHLDDPVITYRVKTVRRAFDVYTRALDYGYAVLEVTSPRGIDERDRMLAAREQ